MLIILLSTYLPQTIGLYVTIILGLGADVYSLILTMVLVGIFMMSILPWFFQMDNQPFYRLSYLLSCL